MKPMSRFDRQRIDPRNKRRQRLAAHLHECGSRPVLEALLDVAGGRDLDETLEDFARVPVNIYSALGADEFPNPFCIVKGGRK
jgi:hypothetical protein